MTKLKDPDPQCPVKSHLDPDPYSPASLYPDPKKNSFGSATLIFVIAYGSVVVGCTGR